MRGHTNRRAVWPDGNEALVSAGVGLASLAVYWRTLYPGLAGIGDTPKFQYVGAVLGTPHNPGYPLYVVLSHLFSRLPFGTLAWRINLLSAVAAALAILLLYKVQRCLGCRPWIASGVALAAGFGPVFWSQATLAEVYALAAALLMAFVWALLRWRARPTSGRLLLAVGLFSLSLGHHLTIVMMVPAALIYVLWVHPRGVLRRRVLVASVGLVVLGLGQYLLILVRTLQKAPYLGSQARTLPELYDVMRGAQFAGRLFAFDAVTVLFERVPQMARLFLQELGGLGVALAVVGLAVLLRRRPRDALLLTLGGCGTTTFILNYKVDDPEVFLIPAFLLVWPLAGFALETIANVSILPSPRSLLRSRIVLAAALALALPASQFQTHYRANDHHDRTFETRYFRALAEALPSGSVLLAESYTVDQMMLYELLGEGYGARKNLRLAAADTESVDTYFRRGLRLYAFGRTRETLSQRGYRFEPVTLWDGPLARVLQDAPAGQAVVLATSRADLPGLASALRTLGAEVSALRGPHLAAVGASKSAGAAVVGGRRRVEVTVDEDAFIGMTGVRAGTELVARAGRDGALVRVGQREVLASDDGVALALVNRKGRPVLTAELDPANEWRVPFTRRAFPLFRLVGLPDCASLGGLGFQDVTARARGGRLLVRLDNRDPAEARLTLYLARDRPLAPRLVRHRGPGPPLVQVSSFHTRAGRPGPELVQALADDGMKLPPDWGRWPFVVRVETRVQDQGAFSALTFDLGGAPDLAFARADLDRPNPDRGLICGLFPGDSQLPWQRSTLRLELAEWAAPFLGYGWSRPHRDDVVTYRTLEGASAEILLPLHNREPGRLLLRAAGPEDAHLALRVNTYPLPEQPLSRAWSTRSWRIPPGTWKDGVNLLTLETRTPSGTSGDAQAVRVHWLRLEANAP